MQPALKKAKQICLISALCSPIPSWWHFLFPAISLSHPAQLLCSTMRCYSCTLLRHLSDRRQRWKKLTQTKSQPKYCHNRMTFRYTDDLGYCLLPVLFHSKCLKNSSWGSAMRLCHRLNTVQRHTSLDFLGIPPPSKNQHVASPLDKGKRRA